MSRALNHSITTLLIAAGAGAWITGSKFLIRNNEISSPVNPFGICQSPYGEVFAMAMQSPIATTFDHGAVSYTPPETTGKKSPANLTAFIDSLSKGTVERTNAARPSKALDLYLRRKTEDQLKFAYQLDPANYSNFNAYHFFLTEPAIGTRPILTREAAQLAERTIQYCLKEKNDPRPALTAAAAAGNILLLMFQDQHSEHPVFTIAQMKEHLKLMDYCLARYDQLSARWEKTGNWNLLSSMRVHECQERLSFVVKTRETAAATIQRLEKTADVHVRSWSAGVPTGSSAMHFSHKAGEDTGAPSPSSTDH
ncbi:MAG: hypothetical protein QM680_12225 [Luteolibacter sp.]